MEWKQCQRSKTTPAKSSGSGRQVEAGRLIGELMLGFDWQVGRRAYVRI